jgi:hypothetical protein
MAVIDTSNRAYNPRDGAPRPMFPGGAKAITKSDTDTFSSPVTVHVGGAGVVRVVPEYNGNAGATVDFTVPAGGLVPCRVWAVYSTGTTATVMVAVY